jgi:hypothetical protein
MNSITPDVGLKAIDVIIKLLPFLKTWTGQRRREYFEKLITPLYTSFEEIHEFYVELILQTRDAVAALNAESRSFQGEPIDSIGTKRSLTEFLEKFSRRRMKDEHLRDTLRQDAQVFLSRITWSEERRFLVSVCFYFLQSGSINPEERILDREATEVIARGGVTYWDTPSMRLYKALQEAKTAESVLDVLDEARHELNQRYMNARIAYRKIQNALVMET